MKEIPILFSTPMVKAILDGRKSQTRRIVKLPKGDYPNSWIGGKLENNIALFYNSTNDRSADIKCPYGKPGDILWVRETYSVLEPEHIISGKRADRFVYKADMKTNEAEETRREYIKMGYPYQWKSSRFMPREACRIKLLIEDIGVEKLKDISDEDCQAEGLTAPFITDHPKGGWYVAYKTLWESINGKGSWDANPFVWVIKFKKI